MAQNDAQNAGIRYLNPPTVEVRKKVRFSLAVSPVLL